MDMHHLRSVLMLLPPNFIYCIPIFVRSKGVAVVYGFHQQRVRLKVGIALLHLIRMTFKDKCDFGYRKCTRILKECFGGMLFSGHVSL